MISTSLNTKPVWEVLGCVELFLRKRGFAQGAKTQQPTVCIWIYSVSTVVHQMHKIFLQPALGPVCSIILKPAFGTPAPGQAAAETANRLAAVSVGPAAGTPYI